MDEIRQFWTVMVRTVVAWLGSLWDRFIYGLAHGWDIRGFIFVCGAIVIIGAIVIWRRRA